MTTRQFAVGMRIILFSALMFFAGVLVLPVRSQPQPRPFHNYDKGHAPTLQYGIGAPTHSNCEWVYAPAHDYSD